MHTHLTTMIILFTWKVKWRIYIMFLPVSPSFSSLKSSSISSIVSSPEVHWNVIINFLLHHSDGRFVLKVPFYINILQRNSVEKFLA